MTRTKALDVVLFITVIPTLPVIATWFLPWEEWIPRYIPKGVIGFYLLYCTFPAWYFGMPWWFVTGLAVWGIVASAIGISERGEERRRRATGTLAADGNDPSLMVEIRRSDGTAIRASCPVCGMAFSTEAFETTPAFPHEQRLKEWYSQHFKTVHATR